MNAEEFNWPFVCVRYVRFLHVAYTVYSDGPMKRTISFDGNCSSEILTQSSKRKANKSCWCVNSEVGRLNLLYSLGLNAE